MPGIRGKSSTKKADHVQVKMIGQGGRAKSYWTVNVDKKTASFTSKRKAEEAAAALRADLAARLLQTASAEDRTVAPAPEAQGATMVMSLCRWAVVLACRVWRVWRVRKV